MITSLVFELEKLTQDSLKLRSLISEGAESADEECTKWKGLIHKSCSVMQQLIDLCLHHVHHM